MRVGVIYGGMSRERDISIRTGEAVVKALKKRGYAVTALKVGDDIVRRIVRSRIDTAFIALHGRYGEDGTVQGLLELLKIPYTGSSCLASAVGMDKIVTKKLWIQEGILTPAFQVLQTPDDRRTLSFPLVAKPPREGSTIGITVVKDERSFRRAVKTAFSMDGEVLLEQYVRGMELTVSVVNGRGYTPIEIRPRKGFYDFRSKYTKGATEYIIPPACSTRASRLMVHIAERACAVLGCSGAARVDFILDERERPFALEVNTIPGMTETSLLPKAAAYHGLAFEELVETILKSARLHAER